jgi:hypothetical protein
LGVGQFFTSSARFGRIAAFGEGDWSCPVATEASGVGQFWIR